MSNLVAVTQERHASRTWQRASNYFFAAKDTVIAIVSQEVPRALASMAVGFVRNEDEYILVGVQGLKPGQNKFVSADGRWLGAYVPAAYRTHPFRLGRNELGVEVLCVDEAAGRVREDGSGEPFFMPDGTPAPAIAEVLKSLGEMAKEGKKTQRACEVLARHDLLEPWPLKAQDGEQVLEAAGLFRVAEAKLYTLDPAALTEVRDSGALMLAFGQLFSMQQVHLLGKLGASGSSGTPPAPVLSEENGIISFANL